MFTLPGCDQTSQFEVAFSYRRFTDHHRFRCPYTANRASSPSHWFPTAAAQRPLKKSTWILQWALGCGRSIPSLAALASCIRPSQLTKPRRGTQPLLLAAPHRPPPRRIYRELPRRSSNLWDAIRSWSRWATPRHTPGGPTPTWRRTGGQTVALRQLPRASTEG